MRVWVDSSIVPAAESGNVVAELVGWESPEEIVVIGAHLANWEPGTGAIDDGAGVGITLAEGSQSKTLLGPTHDEVLWGDPSKGCLRRASPYRDRHAADLDQHVIGSESDFGGGRVWKADPASQSEAGDALFAHIA